MILMSFVRTPICSIHYSFDGEQNQEMQSGREREEEREGTILSKIYADFIKRKAKRHFHETQGQKGIFVYAIQVYCL